MININITNQELIKLICDKVNELCSKNQEANETAIISSLTAQIAVCATLEILEQFGLVTLPKKQD